MTYPSAAQTIVVVAHDVRAHRDERGVFFARVAQDGEHAHARDRGVGLHVGYVFVLEQVLFVQSVRGIFWTERHVSEGRGTMEPLLVAMPIPSPMAPKMASMISTATEDMLTMEA